MIRLAPSPFGVLLAGAGCVLGLAAGTARSQPANDQFANAAVIPSTSSNLVTGSNLGATSEAGEPFHAGQDITPHTVWWSWTPPITGSFTVSTVGSGFDTVLAVYLGSAVSNLTSLGATDDDAGGNGAERFSFRAIVGETYHIAVDGSFGAVGNIQLAVYRAGYVVVPWEALSVNTNAIGTSELTNKVVLVDFWEVTCGACVEEMPALRQLQNTLTNQGFTVLGLYENSGTAYEVRSFGSSQGLNYPLAASTGYIAQKFSSDVGYPRKYLVDREGRVVWGYLGGGTFSNYLGVITPFLRGTANLPAKVSRAATNIVVRWPASEFGYVVESTSNLLSAPWVPVAAAVQVRSNENQVVLPRVGPAQLYRLRKP